MRKTACLMGLSHYTALECYFQRSISSLACHVGFLNPDMNLVHNSTVDQRSLSVHLPWLLWQAILTFIEVTGFTFKLLFVKMLL